MLIVKVHGGIGNQMFCYSLYKKLLNENKNVYLDSISHYLNCKDHNGYEIEEIFNINPNKLNLEESIYYSDCSRKFKDRIRRNLFGKRKNYLKEINEFQYDKSIFNIDNKYLDGYWQSIGYLQGIEKEIKQDFIFKNTLDDTNLNIVDNIKKTNSVSIHIRRGDYLEEKNYNLFSNIATIEYYRKAMKIIEEKVENPVYFIFSNDIEWVKENIKFNYKAIYVDWNNGKDSYKDMQLMSNCKHNIIANSTFSWWGAWLNNNHNKIVIVPKKWINREDINSDKIELFYKDWILL